MLDKSKTVAVTNEKVLDKDGVLELIKREKIETVQIGYADIQGVLRGKYIPSPFFIDTIDKGIPFCVVALGWDIQCEIVEGIPLSAWENGFPDFIAKPDLSTFQVLPWRDNTAFVMCDILTEEGEPFPLAPRMLLKNVIAEANKMGYAPHMASELEFYLLKDDMKTPIYEGIQCYNIYKGGGAEFILSEIRENMAKLGIYIEASNTEYGPAQIEVNIRYSEALDCADKTVLFKNGVKEIARKHDLYATFMSKPWHGESGNGYHVHQSLWDINSEKNLFATNGHGLNDLMKNYLGGLLNYAGDIYTLGAWSVNSYKRVAPYSYAPTRISWGTDNRTTSMRAVMAGNGTRLENRMAAAEANPYLVFAGNIAAGLEGIKSKAEIPEPILGDGYTEEAGELLPTNLEQALNNFEKSKIRSYFNEEFADAFVTIGKFEVEQFRKVVHEWERERYLEMV